MADYRKRRLRQTFTGNREIDDFTKQVALAFTSVDEDLSGISLAAGAGAGIGPYASLPGSPVTGQVYYPTDAFGPLVYDGALWRPIMPGLGAVGYAPPSASRFTAQNGGTSTLTNANGRLAADVQSQAVAGTTTIRGWSEPLVGGSSSYVEGLWLDWTMQNTATRTGGFGVGLRESATGKVAGVYLHKTNASGLKFVAGYWAAMTGSYTAAIIYDVTRDEPYFLRARLSGANVELAASKDRVTWGTLFTVALTTAFTTTADQALIFAENYRPDGFDLRAYLLHYVNG